MLKKQQAPKNVSASFNSSFRADPSNGEFMIDGEGEQADQFTLNDSQNFHNVIDVQNTQEQAELPENMHIVNEHLYVFSKVGEKVDIDLHVRDIVESNFDAARGL